jgi:hypothetical protein
MVNTLKLPQVRIPDPPTPLGPQGLALWRQTIETFDDWHPHELRLLCAACVAHQEHHDITAELATETDFKAKRQLRADRNAAATTLRHLFRELSLSAAPADSRPARIPGRYA